MPVSPANNQQSPTVFGASSATEPTLSVSGRTDGEAYTVSAGARSITITVEAGATLSTTVEKASDGSSVTVTDSTTTTPDWTSPGGGSTGESVQVQVTATKDGLTSQVSWTERVAGSGGGGGGWAAQADYDYSSDNDTSVTITVGGGDTQLYEADGTTAKGLVNASNRSGSPTSSASVETTHVELQAVRTGANQAFVCNWKMTDSDLDFDDAGKLFAVDIVVSGIVLAANDDQLNLSVGNNVSPFGGDAFVIQIREISGATEHRQRRVDGGSTTDTSFSSGAGAISSIAVRWIIFRGRIISMLYHLNGTSPITVVKAGGSVVESWKGGSLGTLEGTPETITTPWYIAADLGPRGTSGQVDCNVTYVKASQLDVT